MNCSVSFSTKNIYSFFRYFRQQLCRLISVQYSGCQYVRAYVAQCARVVLCFRADFFSYCFVRIFSEFARISSKFCPNPAGNCPPCPRVSYAYEKRYHFQVSQKGIMQVWKKGMNRLGYLFFSTLPLCFHSAKQHETFCNKYNNRIHI